ncbi:MAG: hypothetical protein ACOX0R_02910 [Candidatus Dojkabacteria bacterium]|jgi:hypothetical protein
MSECRFKIIHGVCLVWVQGGYDRDDEARALLTGEIASEFKHRTNGEVLGWKSMRHYDERSRRSVVSQETEEFFQEICEIDQLERCSLFKVKGEFYLLLKLYFPEWASPLNLRYDWEKLVFPHLERIFKKYEHFLMKKKISNEGEGDEDIQ